MEGGLNSNGRGFLSQNGQAAMQPAVSFHLNTLFPFSLHSPELKTRIVGSSHFTIQYGQVPEMQRLRMRHRSARRRIRDNLQARQPDPACVQQLTPVRSHIFCNTCALQTGLTSENRNQRVCPACQTHLPNKHDVFQNYLNPSEDWKTNVLGGLSPAIIMECAGKALSFWGYQMTMEM
jgi:hypothetical protein